VQPAIADENTPVEATEAVDTATQVDTDADPAPAVNDADEASRKPGQGAQKRIDELTRKRYDAEREAAYWREQALKQQPPAQPEATRTAAPQELPTLAQFGYDEMKYQAALIDYAAQEAERRTLERIREDQTRTQQAQGRSAFEKRQAEFLQAMPDYRAKVLEDRNLPISTPMLEVIVESDQGPAIAYYLAENRDLAEQIARLPPVQAARAIGRIEARLEANRPAAAPQAPPVSKAPPPPPRIEATEPAVDKDPDQMSPEAWLKWRTKQLARNRR
jgi:hypothetical protein